MGLPAIRPYDLPTAADAPPPRVAWRLDAGRAALLVHDMQRYFVSPFDPALPPMAPVIENIAGLIDACRAAGVPVFYTAQQGRQPRSTRGLQADFWGPGMDRDPSHEAIVDRLAPGPGDVVLAKHRYSAFQRSAFADELHKRMRDQLVVTGVYAHIGCALTAADAFMHDVEPFVPLDAVAAFSRADHDRALAFIAGCCGLVTTTASAIDSLRKAST